MEKLPTDKKHKTNNPDAPNFYYFNTPTSKTRWLPPMPLLPGHESHCQSLPVGIDAASNKGMKKHFHHALPPTQSLEDAVNTGCDKELAVHMEVEVPSKEEEDEEEAELSDLQKIQHQVFTGTNPVKLMMTGPDSLVSRAKDLGFYKNKMTRDEIELMCVVYFYVSYYEGLGWIRGSFISSCVLLCEQLFGCCDRLIH
jgi:hypothetical protein